MSAKKSGNGTKKKQSEESYGHREVVLAHLRGFPWWPAMVIDPETVPKAVAKQRPANMKSAIYAVRFFPTGDYAWLPPKELQHLSTAQIDAYLAEHGDDEKGKQKDLAEGYRIAYDPSTWEAEQAAAPAPQKKGKGAKKRKASEDEDEEQDGEGEGEVDGEDELVDADDTASAGKKRKRTSNAAAAKPKAPAKGKKGGKAKKSKDHVESEDEAEAEDDAEAETPGGTKARASKKVKTDVSNLENDPEATKVREWRHKLQKSFLASNKVPPKDEEMPGIDELFKTVEAYKDMNIDYLTFSKIGKVMRHIHLLEPARVPRDDEFHFRDRAKALVDQWHEILNSNGSTSKVNGHAGKEADGEGDLTMLDAANEE